MKQIKKFLYKTAIAWLFIVFVGVLFGLPSWDEFSLEWIRLRLFEASTLITLFVLAVAFVILSKLRHMFVWLGVLIALAILGVVVDLSPRFVGYPERLSIVRVSLTLIAVLAFWVFERLESKYVGLNISGVGAGDSTMDDLVTLNLDDESSNSKEEKSKN